MPSEDDSGESSPATSMKRGATTSRSESLGSRDRVGDYVLEEFLAEGSFGAVWRARHHAQGTPVALKLLHAHLVSRSSVVLRFEREIEVIQRVRHPNVVRILDHGRHRDGRPFLALELLDGMTLADHLQRRGRLRPAEALQILEPVAGALVATHAAGVIHRDIKPSNVFLAGDASSPQSPVPARVVLLDFGVAKLLDPDEPSFTASREFVGTIASMSPEQLMNRPVDGRTDVYAVGVLAYRMLVGEPPFQSNVVAVLAELHLHVSPPAPSTRAPVSPALDAVILRALSKDPSDRFPTIEAFQDAFRAAVGVAERAEVEEEVRRRALAVHVEVWARLSLYEPGRSDVDADLEAALSVASAELTHAGLALIVETGTSALFCAPLLGDAERERTARRDAVQAALVALSGQRDGLVQVRVCLDVGEMVTTRSGAPVGGALLDVAGWVPVDAEPGVFASRGVLEGLGAAPDSGRVGTLRRVEAMPG